MLKAESHTGNGLDTSSGGDTRAATIIGTSLIGGLIILFLLSTVLGPGGGGNEPITTLQTVPEDSSAVDSLPAGDIPSWQEQKPRFWLQARACSRGDAGWGPDVVAPFSTLWQLDSGGGREFFSAPALVEGVLYLGCNDGYLRAVDASSGALKWSFSTVCGICGEPAVDSTTVYFGGQDGYVYALDRATGSRKWSAGLGYHVFCDTGIMCDSLILSGNSAGKVCALRRGTGEPVWDRELGGIVLGPAIVDTVAAFTSENGVTAVVDRSGELLWSRSSSTQASSPSADSSAVYVGFSGGMVRKFDIRTGDLLWETDIVSSSGRCLLARPVITGGRVLVGTNDGSLVCLDRGGGEVLWRQQFDNWLQLPPAVGQGLIYLACDDQRLHIIDLETGDKVDSLEMGGYSGTAPLLFNGVVFLGNTAGEFRAIRGTLPEEEETPAGTILEETPSDSLFPSETDSSGSFDDAQDDTSESAQHDDSFEEPFDGSGGMVQPLPPGDETTEDEGTAPEMTESE
ncbi:MAG: PQQ-binding-like beta-propeller repeat protein [Candidatus Fermentibacteraceae bacterium]|nr:PQQ-binding-like beta-propeller repeat protein [Candidatus Fermentibacteraceae bacterium]